jgi:endonuclease G
MNSQLESVLEVFEKMINGELEASPETIEILQNEDIIERLRLVILNLDLSDFPLDNRELKDDDLELKDVDLKLKDVDQELKEQRELEIKEQRELEIKEQLEIVIDINTRPVIYIFNNTFQLDDVAIGTSQGISSSIKIALEKAQTENILERAIKATCKISFRDPQQRNKLRHLATGWLIAKNIIVTNSHVASVFATGDDKNPSIKSGHEVSVDFIGEYNQKDDYHNPNKARFKVESVLYAYSVKTSSTTPRYPDIAFLQVSEKSETAGISLPEPISLIENSVVEDSSIVVIGYPSVPRDEDKEELRKQGFVENLGNIQFENKLLQPDRIKTPDPAGCKDDRIAHDCTTFGGNSGSVLVDIATGKAVGLHFGGTRYNSENKNLVNYAVPVKTIQKVAKEIGLDI